jgi:hypothetical protein
LSENLTLSKWAVFGFHVHKVLLDVHFQLDQGHWTRSPLSIVVEHPVQGKNFIGKALVQLMITRFFKETYSPPVSFQSYSLYHRDSSKELLNTLVEMWYYSNRAGKALSLTQNNLNLALEFLENGILNQKTNQTPKIFLVLFFLFSNLLNAFFICSAIALFAE